MQCVQCNLQVTRASYSSLALDNYLLCVHYQVHVCMYNSVVWKGAAKHELHQQLPRVKNKKKASEKQATLCKLFSSGVA